MSITSRAKASRAGFAPLIPLDRRGAKPLYRQIYDWFQQAIVSGELPPGRRMPSTRSLASALGISRISVLNAFEQLHAEGYLQGRVGSGTYVADTIPEHFPHAPAGSPGPAKRHNTSRRVSHTVEALLALPRPQFLQTAAPFRTSQAALDQFPVETWSRLVARHARKASIAMMSYGDPMGYPPLREAIAEYLRASRAVDCEPRQVMVVTGSQQALQLTALALLNRNDPVWMEEPGYRGARQVFLMAGVRRIPVPLDREGLSVEEGIRRAPDARAVYVTPSHQYPMGMTMSAARRMQLLNWAARSGAWIIEDDYDSEYRFDSRPIASLQGLNHGEGTIYIGTFSKVLFPALRTGYLVIPDHLTPAFAAVRDAIDIFSPTLHQAALADFIHDGHFARHIRKMRMLYMERRLLLAGELQRQLGDEVEVVSAEAGMHLVALLPPGVPDVAVSAAAARIGIATMPLSASYETPPARGGLILGYGATDARQIREGVEKLAGCIREQSRYSRAAD